MEADTDRVPPIASGKRILAQFLADWDWALARSAALTLPTPFELGDRGNARAFPVQKDLPRPLPKVQEQEVVVVVAPKSKPKGKGKGKAAATSSSSSSSSMDVSQRGKRVREGTVDPNPRPIKSQHTTVDDLRTFTRKGQAEANQPPPPNMDDRDTVLAQVHALFSLMHYVVTDHPNRLLVRYTRARVIDVLYKKPVPEIRYRYDEWFNTLVTYLRHSIWHGPIREIADNQPRFKIDATPVLSVLFNDLAAALASGATDTTYTEQLAVWILEYQQDAYSPGTDDGGGGIANTSVYTWPNLITETTVDATRLMAHRYLDFVYAIDPTQALPPPLPASSTDTLSMAAFAYHYGYKVARLFLEPSTESDPLEKLRNNQLTELLGDMAVRLVDGLPVTRPDVPSEYTATDLFLMMPIEFIIRVLHDHPRLVSPPHKDTLTQILQARLGNRPKKDAVYGPIEDRFRRLWKRIETIHYLNPDSFWRAWAQVRAASGRSPYEYQWATAMPLIAAEVIETEEPVEGAMRGGFIASDPGTGKTLLALLILVLSSMMTKSTQPTLIVLPPAIVDEWLEAWKRFFNPEAHRMFPMFIYERFEVKAEMAVGGKLRKVLNADTGKVTWVLPDNAILLVKRGTMEKFSWRKYEHDLLPDPDRNKRGRKATRRVIAEESNPDRPVIDLMHVQWARVISDESHTYNNRETYAYEGLYHLIETRTVRPFVYLLSGTPVVRDVIDLVTQLRLMGFKLTDRPEFTAEQKAKLMLAWTEGTLAAADGIEEQVVAAAADMGENELPDELFYYTPPAPAVSIKTEPGVAYDDDDDMDVDTADSWLTWEQRMRQMPFYDRVGDLQGYIHNSKARSHLRQLVFQTEFDILFPLDDPTDLGGRRSLDQEKLFGYYYQLFVDDTPQYQRKEPPNEQVIGVSAGAPPIKIREPRDALFALLYPFLYAWSSRGYGISLKTRRAAPVEMAHTALDTKLPEDITRGDDADTDEYDPFNKGVDELFARHVYFEQWKNQFIHAIATNKYSLEPRGVPRTYWLKSKSEKNLRNVNEAGDLEARQREHADDQERELREQENEAAEEEEEEDDEEVAGGSEARRGRRRRKRGDDEKVLFEPHKTEGMISADAREKLNWRRIRSVMSKEVKEEWQMVMGLALPTMANVTFKRLIYRLDTTMVQEIFSNTLPHLNKHMSFQYLRDIQMLIAYDWRLINKTLYNHLIKAALRTAFAMLVWSDKSRREYMPVTGAKQPLYRMWYVLGVTRLLRIAEVLMNKHTEVFPAMLYLAEQEESILRLTPAYKLVVQGDKKGSIGNFAPLREADDTWVTIAKQHENIRNFRSGIPPNETMTHAEWIEKTLVGRTLQVVHGILQNTRNDKVIIYASNDDILSYMGLMLRFSDIAAPVLLPDRVRLTDDAASRAKVQDLYAGPKPHAVAGRVYYAHVKSTYANVEGTLISYFKHMPACRVLLITFNKGGMGLNLQVANHEIFLTSSLRYTEVRQARDRIYRNNQKKDVHIYHMTLTLLDIPVRFPYPPSPPFVPTIVDKEALLQPGEIQRFHDKVPALAAYDFRHTDGVNDAWFYGMYDMASRQVQHILTLPQKSDQEKADYLHRWWVAFTTAYEYVNDSRLMTAHEVVNEARQNWQLAHAQFYPLHNIGNAATPEQTQHMGFRLALFRHQLSVLLGLA